MRFTYTIEVEVERESGKFASREDVDDALREAIEAANPDTVDGVGVDGDTTYNVIDWNLS